MSQSSVPTARPVTPAVTPVAVVPIARGVVHGGGVGCVAVKRPTEPLAVASAVCGLTAIIPVVSQLLGLALGVVSLIRLRRARRSGVELAGKCWAITGIVTSGFALLGWIGLAVSLTLLGSSILDSAGALDGLLQ